MKTVYLFYDLISRHFTNLSCYNTKQYIHTVYWEFMMKTRKNKDGTYYGKVIVGRTPEGKPVFKRIQAASPVELWKLHYLMKGSQKIPVDGEAADTESL